MKYSTLKLLSVFLSVWVPFIRCGLSSSWSKLKYIPILEPFIACKDNLDPAHGDSCRFWTWKLQKCAFLIANILPRWQVLEYILQQEKKAFLALKQCPNFWHERCDLVWFWNSIWISLIWLDHLSWDAVITRPANQGTQKDSWRVCWEQWMTCLTWSPADKFLLLHLISTKREARTY